MPNDTPDHSKGPQQSSTPADSRSMPKVNVNPQRAVQLLENIASIRARIQSASQSHSSAQSSSVRLIAVSKLKPASDILSLHQPPPDQTPKDFTPQLHFGENYVQELAQKASLLPRSVRWHFIGGLQSNKCRELARDVPNLWAVESVDSVKKAKLLDKGRGEAVAAQNEGRGEDKGSQDKDGQQQDELIGKLRVFVQVNTSGEASKSGVEPKSQDLLELCKTIHSDDEKDGLPNLRLQGLMTIGAIARSQATTKETENEDFVCLRECRDWVEEQMNLKSGKEEDAGDPGEKDGESVGENGRLELSMGMSEDFGGAITQGSDEVRVGSTIFGARPPKGEAKVLDDVESEKE